jgi:hypothetical protein
MRSAEQITEVAQSEYVWDLYVRSGISRSGASDLDALNEARRILETKSMAFANCHLERERVIKALERINVLSSCGIDGLQRFRPEGAADSGLAITGMFEIKIFSR